MPSEYIMYLSILLVGTLAIAGIAVTMIAINNTMEEAALKTNMENILQNMAETIHNLLNEGQNQINLGAISINMQRPLTLPQEIQNEAYEIEVLSSENTYSLKATVIKNEDIFVTVSLFIDPVVLTISGTISSLNSSPTIIYVYDGVDVSISLVD